MEAGVEASFGEICQANGLDWPKVRAAMREGGRYHVETYLKQQVEVARGAAVR
jgi:benzoyl-CoA 2,3-epoxidase subunit A